MLKRMIIASFATLLCATPAAAETIWYNCTFQDASVGTLRLRLGFNESFSVATAQWIDGGSLGLTGTHTGTADYGAFGTAAFNARFSDYEIAGDFPEGEAYFDTPELSGRWRAGTNAIGQCQRS